MPVVGSGSRSRPTRSRGAGPRRGIIGQMRANRDFAGTLALLLRTSGSGSSLPSRVRLVVPSRGAPRTSMFASASRVIAQSTRFSNRLGCVRLGTLQASALRCRAAATRSWTSLRRICPDEGCTAKTGISRSSTVGTVGSVMAVIPRYSDRNDADPKQGAGSHGPLPAPRRSRLDRAGPLVSVRTVAVEHRGHRATGPGRRRARRWSGGLG